MQIMYLRRTGNKKNPGRHPIGLIGVQKTPDGAIDVAVQMAHSSDRFVKLVGRELLALKMVRDRSACWVPGDPALELHTILPHGVSRRLSNYTRHQEILDAIIKDEIWCQGKDHFAIPREKKLHEVTYSSADDRWPTN